VKLRAFLRWYRRDWERLARVAVGPALWTVAAIVLIAIIVAALRWGPAELARTDGLNAKERAEEFGRARTAVLAALAGCIAVIGAIFTARTFGLNRQGHITERFTRAVDQVGADAVDVRLGGIFGLERIARESRVDHGAIMEILTGFVREHAEAGEAGEIEVTGPRVDDAPHSSVRPATDVQAAVTVVARRRLAHDRPGPRLRLHGVDLRGAALARAKLPWVDLSAAHLQYATLSDADLDLSWMPDVHLDLAWMRRARFEGANLEGASLRGAVLERASLWRARLAGADLRFADLRRADLTRAELFGADLTGADLTGANLKRAVYDKATVADVDLGALGAVMKEETDVPDR
jgi:hypothetical protein